MQLILTSLIVFLSIFNSIVLIFLSILLVKLRDSLSDQQKKSNIVVSKDLDGPDIEELDQAKKRLSQESNLKDFYSTPYNFPR